MRDSLLRFWAVAFSLLIIGGAAQLVQADSATVMNASNKPATAKAVIFDNASTAGAGTDFTLGFASDDYAWTLVFSGSPTSADVSLECSDDGGANWIAMDNYSAASPVDFHRSVNDKTCSHLRGNVTSIVSGAVTSILTAK